MDATGDFVVVWEETWVTNGAVYDRGIFAQRYNAAGDPLGGEIDVSPNEDDTNYLYDPRVAMDTGGDFVVVWADENANTSTDSIMGRAISPKVRTRALRSP